MRGLHVITAALISLVHAAPNPAVVPSKFKAEHIITRDVLVIGGGSTGTYAAIQLKDRGHSVVVVERNDYLGGHTNTYIDAAANDTAIDYGVVVFHNLDFVRNYFGRFNISMVATSFSATIEKYVDFRTGRLVNYTSPDPTAGLMTYATQLAQYPYVETGFNLTYPVPADLLLPFGEFVTKYSLQSFVGFLFNFAQGLGNLLAQPTLYVFKNFGSGIIEDLSIGFLVPASGNNGELYDKARAELGSDVLLSSHVVAMDRDSPHYAYVVIDTPSGPMLIRAKQILSTIPPKIHNLDGFDLDQNEKSLFSQFTNSGYYTGLLINTGIPDNTSIVNVGVDTLYNLPILPAPYGFEPTGIPGLIDVKVGGTAAMPNKRVQAGVIADIKRLAAAGAFVPTGPVEPEFLAYSSHTPFELTVSPEAIANGFYKDLYALQGPRKTFWTGAAFDTHDSSLLWQFTETVLAQMGY